MSDDDPRSAVEGAELVFRLADPDHDLTGVRLWQEIGLADDTLDFDPVPAGWELRLTRPTVHRMEYLFEVRDEDGVTRTDIDPTNPLKVGGVYGEHSVLELPGYTAPPWLEVEPVGSRLEPLIVAGTVLGDIDLEVWSPEDADPAEPLPLLLAHDGPELAAYAALDTYVGTLVADGELPRMRLALLGPGERDVWYAADLDYAGALAHGVLPAIEAAYACAPDVVLAGSSLGGLAALHAEWSHPGTFTGLFCQSGSFFTPDTDPQEADFPGFAAVTAFVRRVLDAKTPPSTPYVTLTCGSAEENVHNNRVMAAQLDALGIEVSFAESPDVHNFTAWRDVLDPHLTALLQRVWSRADVDREQVELEAPGLDRPGTVIRYGHWGRPVLVFPSEQGRAWDYESNGMVDAVAPLIEAGRVKLYCVDSFDHLSWSDRSAPVEERARRHETYESWVCDQVAPAVGRDAPGATDAVVTGCSLGAFHALNLALKRADLFPVAICQSGNYDPTEWHAWGDRADAAYFNNPTDYVPHLGGSHLDWLRERLTVVLTVGQGAWETHPTGSLPSARHMALLLQDKQINCELDEWGHDVAHDWPWWQRQIAHHLPRFC